jgi:rRNA maturation endonuclease Nob1
MWTRGIGGTVYEHYLFACEACGTVVARRPNEPAGTCAACGHESFERVELPGE